LLLTQIFFHADQIIRGMYSIFLEVWLRHFPRDSILAIKVGTEARVVEDHVWSLVWQR
jgi:hypothetical protein